MVHVFVERSFRSPLTHAGLRTLLISLPRVTSGTAQWREGFVDRGCTRMLCRFTAAHLDALRDVLHRHSFEYESLWTGSVRSAAPASAPVAGAQLAYVIAERRPDTSCRLFDIGAIDRCITCLTAHRVRPIRMFLADDGSRIVSLYRAPDAESVRLAHYLGRVPILRAWTCSRVRLPAPRSTGSGR